MEIVVGVNQSSASHDALVLGSALAATMRAELVVANVYPVAYQYVSPAHVDAEWRAFLMEQSRETLDWARQIAGERAGVTYLSHGHRSSGVGLAEVATSRGASAIVFGSAPGGTEDRISLGSTADQLFHGSPVPALVAPHGYRHWATGRIDRAVVAYQRTRESDHALNVTVRALLRAPNTPPEVTLLTVIERTTKIYGSRLGSHAEDQVLQQLRDDAHQCHGEAIARLRELGVEVSSELAEGDTVTRALTSFEWQDGDLLIAGSTSAGPIRRVLLGDMTYKILRASTVPVAVIPRSADG